MDESRIPILIGSGQVTQRERDPALGLSPIDLTAAAVQKAADKKVAADDVMNDEDRRKLVSTEKSLEMDVEEKASNPFNAEGDLPVNSPNTQVQSDEGQDYRDADSFFNLPEEGTEADNDK